MTQSVSVANHRACTLEAMHACDDIIDVRTPAEYADDHIPGAINAPVLDDEERARIGYLYKQESAFRATRLGAALAARHIADHVEILFADKPRGWRPLIYCWRGGKRSAAMTDWFNLIGWRARQLEGGYKRWRHHVMAELQTRPAQFDFIVLAGPTGSGKTRLLHALERAGAQILDLEGIARHRGSLLGNLPGTPQPGQRGFETQLLQALQTLDPARPVFTEAESRRIGRLDLPTELLQALHAAHCIKVCASLSHRIGFLLQDYRHLFDAPDAFKATLQRLIGLHSRRTVEAWQRMIDEDRRAELFRELVEQHYDPAYQRSSHSHYVHLPQAESFDYDPTAADDTAQAQCLLERIGASA